jgi:hypothetical protein
MQSYNLDDNSLKKEYENGGAETKATLERLFGKETFITNIKDRIKSFEDACKYLGVDPSVVPNISSEQLKVITQALNENWKPDWSNSSERKWYLFFEYSEEAKRLVFDYVSDWLSHTYASSRLCFKSRDLAEYAAKQFKELYENYINY